MRPKTLFGWFNMLVRGYKYNEETAYILDHTFRPNHRLLSIIETRRQKNKSSEKN